ncbi:MAG: 4-hydroxybenzoate solanesyltransferase [Cyanobacteria bacterium P01_H01_bin.15]
MSFSSISRPEPTWQRVIRLLRWDKPAGRLILMIPALWSVFLAARGTPPVPLVGVIIVGTLATSAAGCVVNDLWDRNLDRQVARTKTRPLAERSLSVKTGLVVLLISLVCAAVLAFYLNTLSFWLCVAAVPVIIGYPLAKRVFPVPQLVLSIAWGFAVLICWSAAVGQLEPETWVLWAATVSWTLGFDTVYAMSDREDDRKVGINSSALFFGRFVADVVGLFYLLTVGLLAYLATLMDLHISFWLCFAIASLGWLWQWWQLRQPEVRPTLYGQIFRQNVLQGFVVLMGFIFGVLL